MTSLFSRICIWYLMVFLHAGVIIFEFFYYLLQVFLWQSFYSLAQLGKAIVFTAVAVAIYYCIRHLVGHNDFVVKLVIMPLIYIGIGICVEYIRPDNLYIWGVDDWPDFWRLARYQMVLFSGAAVVTGLVLA